MRVDTMEEKGQRFWQEHSEHFLEMALRNDKREILKNPDGHGSRTGECGDTVEIFLSVRNGNIMNASFEANGCLNTVACANTVIQMVEGKSLEEAWDVTPEDVVDYLETLPSHENHCAQLAVGALYLALSDAREKGRQPWKKLY
jgi:nitrogen fixation NifU-like protein